MNIIEHNAAQDLAALTGVQGTLASQDQPGTQETEQENNLSKTDSYTITETARRLQDNLKNDQAPENDKTAGARQTENAAAGIAAQEEAAEQPQLQQETTAPETVNQPANQNAEGQANKPMLDLFG